MLNPTSNRRQTRDSKMSEQKPEKQVVGRTLAIALGIICIILAVGLVGAVAYYTSIISGKDGTIASLNSQIDLLNSQMANSNDIVNLAKSTVWVNSQTISQSASSYTYWTPAFSANDAGYVSVNVQSSTTTNTYVEVIWSADGISYSNTITVGTSGTAVFPVLPSTIEIEVGNTNLINGATETVTITYYY
jgi:predicted PurR-regulated permease PerM